MILALGKSVSSFGTIQKWLSALQPEMMAPMRPLGMASPTAVVLEPKPLPKTASLSVQQKIVDLRFTGTHRHGTQRQGPSPMENSFTTHLERSSNFLLILSPLTTWQIMKKAWLPLAASALQFKVVLNPMLWHQAHLFYRLVPETLRKCIRIGASLMMERGCSRLEQAWQRPS